MFDPTFPPDNALIESLPFRNQFTSLKDLIEAVQTITSAQVYAVTTLPPEELAAANVSGSTLHLTFDVPQGANGADGINGSCCSDGAMGSDGPPGPPFAQAVVDGVTTLNASENATVDASFDGSNVRFTFGIPRGNDGNSGSDGANGSDGAPGEVSQQTLDDSITGTSNNSNSVSTLDNSYADADAEELRQKVNELINALRR